MLHCCDTALCQINFQIEFSVIQEERNLKGKTTKVLSLTYILLPKGTECTQNVDEQQGRIIQLQSMIVCCLKY